MRPPDSLHARGGLAAKARPHAAALALVIAALLAYANSFHGPFIFDDLLNITSNKSIRHAWPPWEALRGDYMTGVAGRPAVNFSFALNQAVFGNNPWGWHATNLGIHILAALALFGIIRRTFNSPSLAPRFGPASRFLAFACALLWVVHPINTMAVTYITQRLESLMGLCFLACLYFAVRAWESPRSWPWRLACVLCCLAGVLSKEVMVTAPFLVLAYDVVFVHGSPREALKKSASLYAGLFLCLVVLCLLLLSGHTVDTAYEDKAQLGGLRYALTQPGVILYMIRLIAWPNALCLDYGDAIWDLAGKPLATPLNIILYFLVLAVLAILTLVALYKRSAWGFLSAWFFGILAPTSSFVPLRCFVEEHRMYLPSAALIVAVVAGIYALCGPWLAQRPKPRAMARAAGVGLTAVLALALGAVTHNRNNDFSSALAIWQDTAAKRPQNPRALNNLGMELNGQKKYAQAMALFQKALSLGEDPAKVHCNMGISLAGMGRHELAVAQFEQALKTAPGLVNAHHYLATSLMRLGKNQDAVAHYQKAVSLAPDDAVIRYALGKALGRAGRLQEARASLEKAVSLDGANANAHFELANTYAALGMANQAVDHYRQTLKTAPNHALAHKNLGTALFAMGKYAEAADHLQQACALCPQDASLYLGLARARAREGKVAEAVNVCERAVALSPGSPAAQGLMGLLLLTLGKNRQAAIRMRQAVAGIPGNAELETLLGVALARTGACGESVEHLSRALEIAPGYAPAKNTLTIVSRDCAARFGSKRK